MSAVCPCCGGPVRAHRAVVDLNSNCFVFNDGAVKLSPREAEIMHCLVHAQPLCVPRERLISRVWNGCDITDADNLLSQMVMRLRRKLSPLGVSIESLYGAGIRVRFPEARYAGPQAEEAA